MEHSSSCSSSPPHHRHPYRTPSEEIRYHRHKKRYPEWVIRQDKLREHYELKRRKIEEYDKKYKLKGDQMMRSGKHSRRSSHRSRSEVRSENRRSRDRRRSPQPTNMSPTLESSDSSIPLFKGGSEMKTDLIELRRIKVAIHRNIPASSTSNRELQRKIVDPKEVTIKRREDEGIKSIFDRDEVKNFKCSTSTEEVEEHRTVKTIDTERTGKKMHSSKRRSQEIFSRRRDKGPKEATLSPFRRNEGHQNRNREDERGDQWHRLDRKEYSATRRSSRERSYSEGRNWRDSEHDRSYRNKHWYRESRGRSRERRERQSSIEEIRKKAITKYKDAHQSRSRENIKRDRLHDLDRKEFFSKRRSSRDSSYSEERKRSYSKHDHLSRNGQSCREYRERSREGRERERSVDERNMEQPRDRRMSPIPNYITQVPFSVRIPVPVLVCCHGNFPPRPLMMGGPLMPYRGPLMRNRFPIEPSFSLPPRYTHADI
ncbi:trichohyalin-like [Belonocnema kinseyi]|uniref:trichohyalin-like n=1 Tax=Belonocnema kinseyi TaxID=2817044 RepID=UPI00143D9775|nr:trichohyalin-like [Belonocnema kinseyi]